MRSVLLRARRSRLFSNHLFFTSQLWRVWGFFGISEHFRSQERSFVGHRTSHPNCLVVDYKPQLGTYEPQIRIPSLAAQQHSTIQHLTLTASKFEH